MMVGFSTFFRVVLITLVECDSLTADAKAKLRTLLDESDLGELSEMQPPELLARVHDIVGEALLRRTLAALVPAFAKRGPPEEDTAAPSELAHASEAPAAPARPAPEIEPEAPAAPAPAMSMPAPKAPAREVTASSAGSSSDAEPACSGDGDEDDGSSRTAPGSRAAAIRLAQCRAEAEHRAQRSRERAAAPPAVPPPGGWLRAYVKLAGWWVTPMYRETADTAPEGFCSFPGCPLPDKHNGPHQLNPDLLQLGVKRKRSMSSDLCAILADGDAGGGAAAARDDARKRVKPAAQGAARSSAPFAPRPDDAVEKAAWLGSSAWLPPAGGRGAGGARDVGRGVPSPRAGKPPKPLSSPAKAPSGKLQLATPEAVAAWREHSSGSGGGGAPPGGRGGGGVMRSPNAAPRAPPSPVGPAVLSPHPHPALAAAAARASYSGDSGVGSSGNGGGGGDGGKIGPGGSGPSSSGVGGGGALRYARVTMKLDGRQSSYANGTTAEPPTPTLWKTYARVYVKLRGWWIDPTDMYARAVPTGQCSFPGCPLPDRHPGIHLLDTDLLKSANMGNVRAPQPPAWRRPARACDSSARPWRRRYSRCIRCRVGVRRPVPT